MERKIQGLTRDGGGEREREGDERDCRNRYREGGERESKRKKERD